MQVNRFILFLLFLLLPAILLSEGEGVVETIDNDAHLILKGTYQPQKIIKIKIYNDAYKKDEYFAFLKTDEYGNYQLTKDDIQIQRLKDGNIIFEISTNEEENSVSISNIVKILDKGLTLKISSKSIDEYKSDNIINAEESFHYIIDGETELNVEVLNITISDENNQSISFDIGDITLDVDGFFRIENVDLSSLKDGNITISAYGVDIAGNTTKVEQTILKDVVVDAPVLLKKIKNNNLSNVVNRKILIASGTSEPFSSILFEFTQDDVVVHESVVANAAGEWELLGADLDISVFENRTVFVKIFQIDVAKNRSIAYEYSNEKFKRPIFPLSPLPIDAEKYQLIYTINGHSDEIKSIFITQKEIFVGTYGYIKVWGKSYAKLQREVELDDIWVNTLVVYNGKVFAGLSNGYINVYAEDTLELLHTIQADKLSILHLELYGDTLVSSSSDGLIKIWDTQTYENLHTLKNHQWDVGAIAIDNDKLYSGSDDYSIKIWDLNTSKLLKTLKSAHSGTINDIIIYDGMLISASDDKSIIIRDLQSGEIKLVLQGHKKPVNKLKVTNDFLISVSSDRNMILWDMRTGEILKKIKAHSKKIDAIDVNDFNIVTGSRDYKIKIWGYDDSVESLDSEDETTKPKYALLKSFDIKDGIPTSLSQNENNIIVSSDNGYIFFYNIITHDYVKNYSTLDELIKPVVRKRTQESQDDFEDDYEEEEELADEFVLQLQKIYDTANYGNKLLAALDDSTIKIWDMEKDKAIALLSGAEAAVTDIKISSVYILAATKKGNIGVYDIETGSFVNLIEGHQYNVNSIALYEDDKVVSGGDDYSIKIRDIETGDLILDIKNAHENIITKVLVYENLLISASLDETIKIRDIQTGNLIKVLYDHDGAITSMVLDDENLISVSDDQTLKVWDLKNFNLITTMDKNDAGVIDVMITDDYILSIAKDKSIKVWKYYE